MRHFHFLFPIATEIRCQEKSRGGLSYEVILAEPAPNVAVPKKPVTPGKNVSAEEIENKLKAAEERRIVRERIYCICKHFLFDFNSCKMISVFGTKENG